jgi:hypothetical protein
VENHSPPHGVYQVYLVYLYFLTPYIRFLILRSSPLGMETRETRYTPYAGAG